MEFRHQKKLEKLKKNKLYKSVEPIQFENITSFIKRGKLEFKNPKANEILTAYPTSVRGTSNDNFFWNGVFEEGRGTISIMAQNNEIVGRFNIDNEVYQICDLGGNKNLFAKIDLSQSIDCGSSHSRGLNNIIQQPYEAPIINSAESVMSPLTCNNEVSILIMYSPKVAQSQDPYNTALLCINQLNASIRNSGVLYNDLTFVLAGVSQFVPHTNPPFVESPSINDDLQKFNDDEDVLALRENTHADLVVLLTDGNYQDPLGPGQIGGLSFVRFSSDTGLPNNSVAYSIVDANLGTSLFTFSHEIGHLFLCRHDNQDLSFFPPTHPQDVKGMKFTTQTCSRCWLFFNCCTDHLRETIMASPATSNRIQHFSNPNVTFEGSSTGIIGERNNARQFKDLACFVSNYRTSTEPISVYITGPNLCSTTDYYSWCANVSNCPNVTDINWEISLNGLDFTPFGTGVCITSSLHTGSDYLFLRVTASCDNGTTAVNFYTINIGFVPASPNQSDTISLIKAKLDYSLDNENIVVSPNPTNTDNVQVKIKTENSNILTITLHDLTGKILKNIINTNVFEGILYFDLDVKELSNGMYLIRLQNDNKTITHKLVIQK